MLATIACFFNPCGWVSRTRNLIKFRKHLKGTDLFIVEASHDNSFVFSDSVHINATDENKYIWQKERMFNFLAEQLPDRYTKIAWIDADIIFENENWARETEDLLDDFPVIQLYEQATYLDIDGRPEKVIPSCGRYNNGNSRYFHPGFAWAAQRSCFPLYDENINGGADLCMAHWWLGEFNSWHHQRKSPAWKLSSERQSLRFFYQTKGKLSAISGNVNHMYHGTWKDRGYGKRETDFEPLNFNPATDIAIDDNGLWKWTGNNPSLRDYMTKYLHGRNEDKQLG